MENKRKQYGTLFNYLTAVTIQPPESCARPAACKTRPPGFTDVQKAGCASHLLMLKWTLYYQAHNKS